MATTQPVLDSRQLRKIAEAVSGFRSEKQYWIVLTQGEDGELDYAVEATEPAPRADAVILPCRTPKEADRPHVVSATIRAQEGPEVNLLDLTVDGDPDDGLHTADAVFWGESSIEKFAVPYYASVYGSEAGEAVTALLDSYNGAAASRAGAAGAEPNAVEAYALVHMPRSEYIELDGSSGGAARRARSDRFAVLALDRATGRHRVIPLEEPRRPRGQG